jgi:hypothetical protein
LPALDPAETLNTALEPPAAPSAETLTETPVWTPTELPSPAPTWVPDPAPPPPIAVDPSSGGPGPGFRLVVTAVVALVFGMTGGLIVATLRGSARSPAEAARPGSSPETKAPSALLLLNSEAEARSKAIDALKSEISQAVLQLNKLGARLEKIAGDTAREPEPPRELVELRSQVGQLAARFNEMAALQKDLKRIDSSVFDLYASLRTVRDELAVRPRGEKPAAGAAASDDTVAASEETRSLAQGVKLFKQNRFKESLGIFNHLELSSPNDARVWYFAALSRGFATGEWTGSTEELVVKGIERERAGTPSTFIIDSALDDLTASQGRDWLKEYRRRGVGRPDAAMPSAPGPGQTGPLPGRG